jgi:hypothetical protein
VAESPTETSNAAESPRDEGKAQPPPTNAAGKAIMVADPAGAAAVYLDVLGEIALANLNEWAIKGARREGAQMFVEALKASVKPRDAIEEMLVLQMAFTHARMTRLSVVAMEQDRVRNVQVVNDACDRAANTFRRQMLALAEYRRPPRPQIFAPIRQANVAQLQQVQNGENRNLENENITNELGFAPPAPTLPAVAEGAGVPARGSAAPPPLAEEHRPADDCREDAVADERPDARRAQRRPRRSAPRDQ